MKAKIQRSLAIISERFGVAHGFGVAQAERVGEEPDAAALRQVT